MELAGSMDEEQQRYVREGFRSDEELSMYDLLFTENLSKQDIQVIKKVAVELLAKVKAKIAELDHWTDKRETKAAIDNLIRDMLWTGLPECYDDISVSRYRQQIYEYVYIRYKNVADKRCRVTEESPLPHSVRNATARGCKGDSFCAVMYSCADLLRSEKNRPPGWWKTNVARSCTLTFSCYCSSKPLIFFRRPILHDILNAAIQDDAQVVDGGCIQRLVLTQLVNCGTGNVVILDERIGRLGRLLQRCPESIVYDHRTTLPT